MSRSMTQDSLGLLIKTRRKEAALTQEVAAMLCGVTKKTLIRVEKGEDIYVSTLFKILDGLGISLAVESKPDAGSSEWY
ncbi:helix-turn-helix domain-containing protein [Shewanella sp. AS1]|uniref:helix-turn-helix domain-containing protein n=1 Tax=Shewanella sp. AS1 TaxID=2907626 RepID=UPI001F333B7C|nr:helix-turn-helix transcriptional regulator [Shewanella sp. AS1]MCE9679861.1 helix-turn-helix domain-containing protein [Shewanella sp. AS1]